ncbi:MAG: hypothetical protein ACE37J_05010 [Pikeienuella sp.]|uniref:hypothetical protein n=1 Tax=Pikeienuella sp. TaxID=2831957 RepID=UPI00391CA1FE
MSRWMGLSLDGWHDFAARDWDPEDQDARLVAPVAVDGGPCSVVVDIGERKASEPSVTIQSEWIGGPQAALAPHGRGNGWGRGVGAPEHRRRLRDSLRSFASSEASPSAAAHVAAAAEALTRGAERLMVAVPDFPEFAEAAQRRMLDALTGPRRPRARLLWRSVATIHGAEAAELVPRRLGFRVRILVHCDDGVEVQTLTWGEATAHQGWLAPVRDGYGATLWPELGLETALARADSVIRALEPEVAAERTEPSSLAARLLFGEGAPGETELLRRNAGGWIEIEAPHLDPATILPFAPNDSIEGKADATLLVSPLVGPFAKRLHSLVATRVRDAALIHSTLIAKGALIAGRIIDRGLPHYLDRLEPIALAVLVRDGPRWERLTPPDDRHVPANEEFVSEERRDFFLRKGQTEIVFFVLKGAGEVRRWRVEFSTGPEARADLVLRLRQTPGQSWASLSIGSESWELLRREPILLNWETLDPEPRSPDDVLAELEPAAPPVPSRSVEEPHGGFWRGEFKGVPLAALVAKNATADELYKQLRRQSSEPNEGGTGRRKIRPVGTDGALPPDLPRKITEAFHEVLDRMGREIDEEVRGDHCQQENRRFLCLTWSATLCPAAVQDHILDALAADNDDRPHPLLRMTSAKKILQQGAGRAVAGSERVRRALGLLASRPRPNNDTFAALGHLLTRRAEAPNALTIALAQRLGELARFELADLNESGNYKGKFMSQLGLIAGLLRFREVESSFLIRSRDHLAEEIAGELTKASEWIKAYPRRVARGPAKCIVVENLLVWLEGEGGDPNIIGMIDAIEEDD